MRKIREILRLHGEQRLSARAIARSCRMSHSSVLELVRRAEQAGLSWPLPQELDDATLEAQLYPKASPESGGMRPSQTWP